MENDLQNIFNKLKSILQRYNEKLITKIDAGNNFDLWSQKEIIVAGKNKSEMFFASIQIQKNDVAFHFMPLYTDPNLIDELTKSLRSKMKGKSCFHIKKLDEDLENEISDLLKKGYEIYKNKDWI